MSEDEEAIRQLVSTWMRATREGDIDKVLSLMTDDAVFLTPGQAPMCKEDFAAVAREQAGIDAPSIEGESRIQEIKVLGDWAWMWAELTIVVTLPDGKAVKRSGHTLSVLTKKDGQWRLARDANMLTVAS